MGKLTGDGVFYGGSIVTSGFTTRTLLYMVLLLLLSSSAAATASVILSWFQTFVLFWMLCVFFLVIPRSLNFICRRFGTLCLFHLHRRIGMKYGWIREKLEYLSRKRFGSKIFEPNLFLYKYPNFSLIQPYSIPTCLWRWNRQRVPKRRHIKFRLRGITKKKAHNIDYVIANVVVLVLKRRLNAQRTPTPLHITYLWTS